VLLGVGVLLALRRLAGGRPARADLPLLAVVGVFDVAANGTFALATQSGLVSVSAVLASLYPVVTAVLAWRLHGERLTRLQVGGVALAMAGVVLLAAG
jgi:drug/metabolite transporter (DMT)-like permease